MKFAYTAAETSATVGLWGFVNERFGNAPTDDPEGLKEVHVLGLPVDLGAGLLLLGMGFVEAAGKGYSDHLTNVGNGSVAAFTYRWGAELARRHPAHQVAAPPTTKGARPQMTATGWSPAPYWERGPQGGRVHHVQYTPR